MERKLPHTGQRDTKVTLYRMVTEVHPQTRERTETPEQVCETYAYREGETGSLVTDDKVHHVVKVVFVIRKRAGILGVPNLMLVSGGLKYTVTHVEQIRRSDLRIECTDPDAWAATP